MTGDILQQDVLFKRLAEFPAVHHGHHIVADNKIRHFLQDELHAGFSIAGLKNLVMLGKCEVQNVQDVGIVIDR